MEKVILITSREINKKSTDFEEIEYGEILQDTTGRQVQTSTEGYFRQFCEWVKSSKKDEDFPFNKSDICKSECIDYVKRLIVNNNPKKIGTFCVGIYRKVIENGPTIYIAEEFPCEGEEKRMFSEHKKRYLNSIIMEICHDMKDQEIEWQIISHDNDWGYANKNFCLKKANELSSIVIETKFNCLRQAVHAKTTEIRLFQHVIEDDIYLYVKLLLTHGFYDLFNYLDKAKDQKLKFKKFLESIDDIDNIDMESFRELKIDPKIPFLPL